MCVLRLCIRLVMNRPPSATSGAVGLDASQLRHFHHAPIRSTLRAAMAPRSASWQSSSGSPGDAASSLVARCMSSSNGVVAATATLPSFEAEAAVPTPSVSRESAQRAERKARAPPSPTSRDGGLLSVPGIGRKNLLRLNEKGILSLDQLTGLYTYQWRASTDKARDYLQVFGPTHRMHCCRPKPNGQHCQSSCV